MQQTFYKLVMKLNRQLLMKTKLSLLLFFITCATFSQRKPEYDTQKDKNETVKKVIMKFFDGFHAGDTVTIAETIHKDVIMQTIYKDKDGNDQLHQDDINKFMEAVANRPSTQRWNE